MAAARMAKASHSSSLHDPTSAEATIPKENTAQLILNLGYAQNGLSDDERLSDLMNCETLRSIVACDSQTITVRELEFEFSFGRIIECLDCLLK
jgi:hypothetical protein